MVRAVVIENFNQLQRIQREKEKTNESNKLHRSLALSKFQYLILILSIFISV